MKEMQSGQGGRDAAIHVRQRMETRGKRRLVKRILARNAQWRRLVSASSAAGMAALLAGLLMLGEAAAMVV